MKSVLITAEVEISVLGESGQYGESLNAEMKLEREEQDQVMSSLERQAKHSK